LNGWCEGGRRRGGQGSEQDQARVYFRELLGSGAGRREEREGAVTGWIIRERCAGWWLEVWPGMAWRFLSRAPVIRGAGRLPVIWAAGK